MPNINKKAACLVVKIGVWTYIVPCAILAYVSVTLHFDKEQSSIFFAMFLLLVTIFNIVLVKKLYSSRSNANPEGTQPPTNNAGNQLHKTESSPSTTNDLPPSYNDVNEDPPPYSQLRYFWKMIQKSPFKSSSKNGTLSHHSSYDVENQPTVTSPNTVKEKIKRNFSSPY